MDRISKEFNIEGIKVNIEIEKSEVTISPKVEISNIVVIDKTNDMIIIDIKIPTKMGEIKKYKPSNMFTMTNIDDKMEIKRCEDNTIIPCGIYRLQEYLGKDIMNKDPLYIYQSKILLDSYREYGCDIAELGEDGIFRCLGSIHDCNFQPLNVWCPMKTKLRDMLK